MKPERGASVPVTEAVPIDTLPTIVPPQRNAIKNRISEARQRQAEQEKQQQAAVEPSVTNFVENRDNLDTTNPAFPVLQSPSEVLAGLPLDTFGRVNWVKAIESGMINPRANLDGSGQMVIKQEFVIMKNTRSMPWVKFPHRQHTEWLACSNCHPHPFKTEANAHEITMETIMRGEHCGKCHDRVAFSIIACERCHSVTHPGSPIRWW
jgi:c(7)-type cytochrome triheme protein